MPASESTARFVAALMFASAWCVGRLPLRLQYAVGSGFAWIAQRLNLREAKVVRRNFELLAMLPNPREREAAIAAVLRATAWAALESLRVWTRPPAANLALIRAVKGLDVLAAGEATGRGVIIVAPHYGSLELVVEYMAARGPFALVYRVPEKRAGDLFLRRARGRDNTTLVPAESTAMRPLWKALADGGTVGITPDQQPKLGGGEFAPFFGKAALTLSLIPRLAGRSGAAVVFAFAERQAEGGFVMHFQPGDPDIANADLAVALAAMNAQVEAIARRDLWQYQWTYKRYTIRPPGSGESNPYHPDCY